MHGAIRLLPVMWSRWYYSRSLTPAECSRSTPPLVPPVAPAAATSLPRRASLEGGDAVEDVAQAMSGAAANPGLVVSVGSLHELVPISQLRPKARAVSPAV